VSLEEDIRLHLQVNGVTKQHWPISDMIFNVPQVLAYALERVNLMPGDILITGSPLGNGMHHGQFLQLGDVVASEITFLGRQRPGLISRPS
jgi:2-keto-4-pentenoate hydratase/2-oxohepta-3-ene-1,7-dioic acid hydratase in catechol pathway